MKYYGPLQGVDSHPWDAYGCRDMPEVLLALTSPDGSDEAMPRLYDYVMNEDVVYPATIPAVSYIARLASSGVHTLELLYLLGRIAGAEHGVGVAPTEARSAVTRQLQILITLLNHNAPDVRKLAVWAVAQCQSPIDTIPALEVLWRHESAPMVRADLLLAFAFLDPEKGLRVATQAINSSEVESVQLSAILALVKSGAPWTNDLCVKVISMLPTSGRFEESAWTDDPLFDITASLSARGEIAEACHLVTVGLESEAAQDEEARLQLIEAGQGLVLDYPSARVMLLQAFLLNAESPGVDRIIRRELNHWINFREVKVSLKSLTASHDANLALRARQALGEA
ncbi:HEAT repeat domain-containing protein [Streptomyces sp. NPDC086796]|uniref:HEAT repeat domain-containing protein n=1 Tax=unclassified Streptomyces TaxID=2593676 RepID=UPI003812156A